MPKGTPMHLILNGRYIQVPYYPLTIRDFRVNGMMMNSPAFAAAYKCRLGSYMNPKRKCTIW